MRGIILYGPPASGKDTITRALHSIDSRYTLFRRLKVGGGRTYGYRIAKESDLEVLRKRHAIVWENHRYDAVYAVDYPSLLDELVVRLPVLHLGQAEAVSAVTTATPAARWLIVSLWCPRDVAIARIVARGTSDVVARVQAWDETEPLASADLTINTADVSAVDAAREIHRRLGSA